MGTTEVIGLVLMMVAVVALVNALVLKNKRAVATARRMSQLEAKVDQLAAATETVWPEPSFPEVVHELQRGRKINAIKAYRDATGVDLAEAKRAVERIERGESPT